MNVRFALALLMVTSTAAAAPTPPSAQDLRDVASGDVEAEDVVALIAMKDRVATIHDLIRAGGSCKQVPEECVAIDPDADRPELEVVAPGEKETASSPCFRRWYLLTLATSLPEDEHLRLSAKELHDLAKLDRILLEVVEEHLVEAQQLELASLFEKQQRDVPFSLSLEHDAAVKALKKYHLAAAVPFIDALAEPELVAGVMLDPTYPEETRSSALQSLLDAGAMDQDRLAAIVRPLVGDASLDLAAQAAAISGLDLHRPKTPDPGVVMRFVALAMTADESDTATLATYAPRGLDIVDMSGHLIQHVGPTRGLLDQQGMIAVAEEIRTRVLTQAPLLGRTKHGNVVLRGFIEPPEEPETVEMQSIDWVDDPDALEKPGDPCNP